MTGVPKITKSNSSITDGSEVARSKMGTFNDSDIVWAKRLVFPVREKYNTQAFMVLDGVIRGLYNVCLGLFSE
jgi:hypothetical protein